MPAALLRITFLLFLFGCSARVFGHVALDYPVGGETYIQGQTVTIEWHIVAFHPQLNWDLYFSEDGGNTWQPIQLDIPVDILSFDWIVPSIETSQGRIKIFQDNVEHDYLDVSMDFTIVPNTSPPSLDAPANDLNISCGPSQQAVIQAWLDNHGGAVATQYCDNFIWTHDYNGLSNECGNTGSALITFTAEDDCGSTFTVATLTVSDVNPPFITVLPSDLEVECDGQGNIAQRNAWLNNQGGAVATDSCGNVSWSNNFTGITMNCGMTGQAVVQFKVTDACGNTSLASATFRIKDRLAPQIFQPARDTILECGSENANAIQNWLNEHAGAQATDLCGGVSWANNFSSLGDYCGLTGNAVVFFTATDACGNSSITSASISIEDHVVPVMDTAAHDLKINCSANDPQFEIQNWLDDHGGARAHDLCGNVNWIEIVYSPSDTCFADSSLITFTAFDECGNSAATQAWLIISDTTVTVGDSTTFAPIGATWYYSSTSGGPPWQENALSCLFLVEKDTAMLGYDARVIGCYVNEDGQLERRDDLTKYVATVGQKVYYKVGGEFVLLYDFGAQPGDTIYSKVEPFELSLGCNDVDSITDFSYVIDSVQLHNIDGEDLLAQYVHSLDETDWGFWDWIPIYERMGNWGWGGYWWGRGYGCILETGYLRCYVDDEITWHDSSVNEQYGCDYLSTPEVHDNYPNVLYPNPTEGIISLYGQGEFVGLYSLDGRPARFSLMDGQMDLKGNAPGVYIVKVENKRQVYFSKVVLQ